MRLHATVLRVLTTAVLLTTTVPLALIVETQSPALAQSAQNSKAEAGQLNQQGMQQLRRAEYRQALESFQKALALSKSVGDRSNQGQSLNNIGGIYYSLVDCQL